MDDSVRGPQKTSNDQAVEERARLEKDEIASMDGDQERDTRQPAYPDQVDVACGRIVNVNRIDVTTPHQVQQRNQCLRCMNKKRHESRQGSSLIDRSA